MMHDLGAQCSLEVLTDATAAKGMASRRGLGKPKHMHVQYLWIQERIARKDFKLSKVWGHENPADLMTKHLDSKTIQRFMTFFGIEYRGGRADSAPTISHVQIQRQLSKVSQSIRQMSARCRPQHRDSGDQ